MCYRRFMTYLVSISSRGLVYLPSEVQQKLKIKRPGKMKLVVEDNKIRLEPVPDIMEFAGKGRDKAHLNIWKNFRDKMETGYEDVR